MYDPNPTKSIANLASHGVSFESAERFEWDTALEAPDTRHPYPEVRTIAIGYLGDRLHVAVDTMRAGRVRFISVRKAHPKEAERYVEFFAEG
ncbi:BrnT family toxin [Hansschlegelia sp. KR7-227]|uniref:BrnT family toxin n=1 Tax=Hansschlegelia sp. KR7-227 TaxID=3400914 RepID=UPI003C11750B